jgi:hypothetical protein
VTTVERPAAGQLDAPEILSQVTSNYIRIEDKTYNRGEIQVFTISFIDGETDTNKFFNFALLPAIETTANRGQGGVPEVKPGLVTMTSMRYKNFIIPGSTPVIQSIGVQSTVHQFVGAFVGSENIDDTAIRATMDFVYPLVGQEPPWTNVENSFNKANLFDKKVVQSGRPITMTLRSDIDYVYEGVIVGFKFYAIRADRAYYTLDLMGTVYHRQKPPLTSEDYITDGKLSDPGSRSDTNLDEILKDNKLEGGIDNSNSRPDVYGPVRPVYGPVRPEEGTNPPQDVYRIQPVEENPNSSSSTPANTNPNSSLTTQGNNNGNNSNRTRDINGLPNTPRSEVEPASTGTSIRSVTSTN